ncbi:MAG: AAA family ATPase [Deltaproteobacteria bacterium]|nr:AAA family ATPase [Deltaproteobacteria bacterium]
MKIHRLRISGFRSLKDVTWAPGGLNVLIGPNGTGKSNVLRCLDLISASARGELGKWVQRSGGIDPLVWDGKAGEIALKIEFGKDSYAFDLQRLGRTSLYRIRHEELVGQRVTARGRTGVLSYLERQDRSIADRGAIGNRLRGQDVSTSAEETALSLFRRPLRGEGLPWVLQTKLADWRVYHDVNVFADSPVRGPVVARSEKRIEPDGGNLVSVLHTLYTGDREFKKDIDAAMRAAFGDDYDELLFPPAADQRIQLRVRWKSLRREQSAADLSDGTLRFLFLLTVLASPAPPSLIAIDEPETGLHPSMMPVVAEYAADASDRAQIIFTTHSAQFLDAFGDVKPVTTVLKWRDGETVLKTIEGKEIEYWLKEYSLGTLFKSGELEDMT